MSIDSVTDQIKPTKAAHSSELGGDIFHKKNAGAFKIADRRDSDEEHQVIVIERKPFHDDPSLSPAKRSLNALVAIGKNPDKTMTPEEKKAFEGALSQADAEAKTGGSPRLPGMKSQFDKMQSEIQSPEYKEHLDKLGTDLKASIDKLSSADKRQLDTLLLLRGLDPERTDAAINKLVPSSDANKTFTQKLDEFDDQRTKPKQAQELGLQIQLEQRQQLATRIFYSSALAAQGTPEADAKAKQLMQQVMDMDPTVYKEDPLSRKLMDKYGIKPQTPL
jgi:hypothetical protein